MLDCGQQKTLQAQLDEAIQDWYAVKDIPLVVKLGCRRATAITVA